MKLFRLRRIKPENMRLSISSAPKPLPSISVVIVNFNAGEWLSRCVESVVAQTYENFKCVIVDNGSTDGSLETLGPLDARFEIIKANDNLGFAAGSNLGANRHKSDWIAMLNPDAFARIDWLEQLIKATNLAPNVTMVGSTQYMALDPDTFDGLGDYYHVTGLAWRAGFGHTVGPIETREAFGPCGAGAFYHGDTFRKLRGYDESFFCYHEDVDLAYRMRLFGGICIQTPHAKIDHISSGISGRASDFAVFYGTRNRIWTFYKNTPFPLIIFLMPVHIATTLFFMIWSFFRGGRAEPTWRGVKAGLKGIKGRKADRVITQTQFNKISTAALLRAFSYSPIALIKRRVPNTKTYQDKNL